MPSLDTRWTYFQRPYIFQDALGFTTPIPAEYDFELIKTIIKHKFKDRPGYRQVLLGNYEIFETQHPSHLISADTHITPGTAITMAILLNHPVMTEQRCPMPQCRSTGTVIEQRGGKRWSVNEMIASNGLYLPKDSCECSVWFGFSTRERKSFGDVARFIEDSEYRWLADHIIRKPSPYSNARTFKEELCREDICAYRNVKFSNIHMAQSGQEMLEENLHDVSEMCY